MKHDIEIRQLVQEVLAIQGPSGDPLRQAWRDARRRLVSAESDGLRRAALVRGDGAVDPGESRWVVSLSPTGAALSVLFGALCVREIFIQAARLLALEASLFLLPVSLVGAALGAWMYVRWCPALRRVVIAATRLSALSVALPMKGRWRRALLAALGGAVLYVTRVRRDFDRVDAEERIVLALEAELRALAPLSMPEFSPDGVEQLVSALQNVVQSRPEDRDAAFQSLLFEAERLGFEGLVDSSTPRRFEWSHDSAERYKLFGLAEAGQLMQEERPPVVRDGLVVRKGVARRLRS